MKTYTSFAVRMRPRQLRWHAPVVKYLIELEMDGIIVYDVYLKQEVLAVAPVLCKLGDNPRASELLAVLCVCVCLCILFRR